MSKEKEDILQKAEEWAYPDLPNIPYQLDLVSGFVSGYF